MKFPSAASRLSSFPVDTGDVRSFAKHHRLKCRLDNCDDPIIRGKYGEIGEHGDGRLNACFHGVGAEKLSRVRAMRIRETERSGLGSRISGEPDGDEALFAFDPNDVTAAEWFIKNLGIKRKRRISSTTAERLRSFNRLRQSPAGRPLRHASSIAKLPIPATTKTIADDRE
jgi:hypothetical protein